MTLVIVVAQIDISVGSLFAICGVALRAFGARRNAGVAAAAGRYCDWGRAGFNQWSAGLVRQRAVHRSDASHHGGLAGGAELGNGRRLGGRLAGTVSVVRPGTGERARLCCSLSTAVVFAALWWASKNLRAFRAIYATGSDAEAARLAGIKTRSVVFAVFILIGSLTGLAAVLNAVRFSDVPANAGIGLELQAIAAVVVGGTPITGGRGRLMGTLIGVALLGSIAPALLICN